MVEVKKAVSMVLLAMLLFSCFPLFVNADTSWLEGYSRRMLFYWQSSASGQDSFTVYNQTGFNSDSKFYIFNETQSDFEDLRVTLADGTTELSLWNQTTTEQTSVKVWCIFPTANASYYLYWNNAEAVASWNQSAVFTKVLSGLIGAWPLNEQTAIDAVDYSGQNNTGTVTNTGVIDSPFYNGLKARSFAGADKFDMGSPSVLNFDATDSFSVLVNFQTSFTAATQSILRKGYAGANPSYLIRVDGTTGKITARIYDTTTQGVATSTDGFADGAPHTLFAVFNRTSQRITLYVDGVYQGISNDLTTIGTLSNAAPFCVGSSSSSSDYFNGAMGDLFIFNSAVENFTVTNQYFDYNIILGSVFVRSWITGNSIILFGGVESAPVVEPTVNPADVSADDAAALAVVFGFIAIALAVAFGVSKRK